MSHSSTLILGSPEDCATIPPVLMDRDYISVAEIAMDESSHRIEALISKINPDLCIWLSPFRIAPEILTLCLSKRIQVVSAGPVPFSDQQADHVLNLSEEGNTAWWIYPRPNEEDSKLAESREALRRSGLPVYYKDITTCKPDVLSMWWALCRMVEKAEAVIDSTIVQACVTSTIRSEAAYAVCTVKFSNRANAHLILTGSPFKSDAEWLLVSSGGMSTMDGLNNRPGVYTENGFKPIEIEKTGGLCPWWHDILHNETLDKLTPPDQNRIKRQLKWLRSLEKSFNNHGIVSLEH